MTHQIPYAPKTMAMIYSGVHMYKGKESLMRYIQFDDNTSQTTRRQANKFCLVEEVWNRFVLNCHLAYHSTTMLTVDYSSYLQS